MYMYIYQLKKKYIKYSNLRRVYAVNRLCVRQLKVLSLDLKAFNFLATHRLL